MQIDHRVNRREDVSEDVRELVERTGVARQGRHLAVKLVVGHLPALEAEQQRRLVQQDADVPRITPAVSRQPARHDPVIEIQQHLAEVENHCLRSVHAARNVRGDGFWGKRFPRRAISTLARLPAFS